MGTACVAWHGMTQASVRGVLMYGSMATIRDVWESLDVDAGVERVLGCMYGMGSVWLPYKCTFLPMVPLLRRRSALLHSTCMSLPGLSASTKELWAAMPCSRYSKPVMRSVCSILVLLSICLWWRRLSARTLGHTKSNQDPGEGILHAGFSAYSGLV